MTEHNVSNLPTERMVEVDRAMMEVADPLSWP
jgi:hypothetical protein